MNLQLSPKSPWLTAAFGDGADTLPLELNELSRHVQQCSRPHSRLYNLRCTVVAMHQKLLARFVTSLTLLVAVTGALVVVI